MKRTIGIILGVFILANSSLFAIGKDPLWEEKADSQIKYQADSADLLLKEIPDAKEIILIQRDMQIIMIKMRTERYYYLLQYYPDKITKNQGISGWSNFEWDEEDEKELLRLNGQYKNLKDEYELLKGKNQNHQQWPMLREKFSKIKEMQEYRKIQDKLSHSLNTIEERLKNRQ